jgi:hypothetical protein
MSEEQNNSAWQKAIKSFSQISDGFWIIGYRNQGNERFAFGLAEDPALEDALVLPQHAAHLWATDQRTDSQE